MERDKFLKEVKPYKIEALLTMDNKGQILIPKDLRKKFKLEKGSKITVSTVMEGEDGFCMILMNSEKVEEKLRETVGPLLNSILK